MHAAAHFDQFSQALCINVGAIRGISDPQPLLGAMLQTGPSALRDSVAAVAELDDRERLAGVLLLSTAWHEKRHFSDLVLTSFGAYRTRLNFQAMFAGPALVREARAHGRLVVPITAYADPVRLQSLGVEPPYPPNVLRMGENLAARYAFHELDRLPLEPGLNLGATSCLEALAYMSQVAAIEYHFGAAASAQVQLLLHEGGLPKVYTWVRRFGRELGLVEDMGPGWPEGAVKVHRAAPLLFMALCGRSGNLRGEGGSPGGSLAAERLPRLAAAMLERKLNLQGMDGAEAWEALDRLHLDLWGRRCADELEADLERDDELLGLMVDQDDDSAVVEAFDEYAGLRRRMVAEFRADPQPFVDPYVFPATLLPRLHPRPRLEEPKGQFFPVPEGWAAVCDGALPEHLVHRDGHDLTRWSRWWWSITPKAWTVPAGDWGLESASWIELMQFWAPSAKFLIGGRAAPDCLGPELQMIERAIGSSCELLIEPHAARGPTPDPASFWFGHGRAVAQCDFSGEPLDAASAVCISPWRIHLSERNLDFVLERYQRSPIAPSLMLKDWSIWVVHRRFDAELEA